MLNISESAKRKILGLLEAEGQQGLGLRVAVQGGGPGTFRYELGFEESRTKGPKTP